MQEQEKQTPVANESIRTILERAEDRSASGEMRKVTTEKGATEFLFEEQIYRQGLVFEEEMPAAPSGRSSVSKKAKEEFSLPSDIPASSADAPAASYVEEPLPAYHAYVPVFTEASEKYRMTGYTGTQKNTAEPSVPSRKKEVLKAPAVEVVASTDARTDISVTDVATDELPEKNEEDIAAVHVRLEPLPAESYTPTMEEELTTERTQEDEKNEILRILYGDAKDGGADDTTAIEDVAGSDEQILSASTDTLETKDTVYYDQGSDLHIGDAVQTNEEKKKVPDPTYDDSPVWIPTDDTGVSSMQDKETARGKEKLYRQKEFQMYSDATKHKNRFLDILFAVRVRLIVCTGLMLLLAGLAMLPAFGLDVRSMLGLFDFKALPALIDAQLCLCVVAITLPELIKYCKQLFAKRPVLSILPIASGWFVFAYDIYVCFADITSYPLFGSLFALGYLSVILTTDLMQSAMFSAFKLISVKGGKTVIERVRTRDMERENMALDGAVDEYSSYTARMSKTTFVFDFFRRHREAVFDAGLLLLTLSVVAGCSLVTGVVAFFLNGGWFGGLYRMTLVFLAGMPVAWVVCRPLSYWCAQRCCFCQDSASIGEESLFSYNDIDVVTYTDTEVFGEGDVSMKRVLIYGDKSRLPVALRRMASLFLAAGGPLSALFANTLDRRPLPASHLSIELDGIRGVTEGCTVHAGTAEYMCRQGFTVPESSRQDTTGTTRVLYLAEGGVVYAKFIFRYAFSEAFSQLIPVFKKMGIVPLVYTCDPNITRELLCALTTGEDVIREMHVSSPTDTEQMHTSISAGMVTLGDKGTAVQMLFLSKEYTRFQHRMGRVYLGQALVGILIGALFAFVPALSRLSALPWIAGWQVAWCAATVMISTQKFSLRKKRKEMIESEEELAHE